MILSDINHKMPIYRDCTLSEVMMISFASILILMGLFIFITIIIFGYGWIGCVLALLLWVPITKYSLSRLQKLKFGKPYGYYQQLFIKTLGNSVLAHFIPIPYLSRCGKWSVRREIKNEP